MVMIVMSQVCYAYIISLLLINIVSAQATAEADSRVYYSFPKINHPLKITTVLIEPYVMLKPLNMNNTKESPYEGFVVDILDKLAEMLFFTYVIHPVKDGKFGFQSPNGTWDGMIGEVRSRRADVAAAPLFATERRRVAVDFCLPFLEVKATVVISRHTHEEFPHITSWKHLALQNEIKVGTLNTGLIIWAFRASNDTFLKQIWSNMLNSEPSVFTSSNEEGIDRVRKERYAFVIPNTIADYVARRPPCDLVTLGDFLMDKSYAFAMAKASILLPGLNKALHKLRDMGYIDRLYYKWWIQRGHCNGVTSSRIYTANNSGCSPTRILCIIAVITSYISSFLSCPH